MKLAFTLHAWEDYNYWQKINPKMVKKINELIKVILRTPFEGIGKPEPLKHDLAGFWSRRIDQEHRIVYHVDGLEITIISCRFHYDS
ncbi:Txe/YoeB family addiction module toxin [Mongoliitalea daihaiensis]|uniref:Txe/YoeB family addiction module toxin n=1 Tax=Mongoliitalea daihaiensis TaxID=2782006 RepID=UPI001F43347C|nr:Txe/YoeB family addiction module toxin [Mongoliitalea daihaiensis]UJP65679.1 Txe/YoeB family addiction module toxin [Mongoliitalea daihaiensis]